MTAPKPGIQKDATLRNSMIRKRRVLHVYLSYEPQTFGGVERMVSTLCQSMATAVEHRLITTSTSDYHHVSQEACEVFAYRRWFSAASCPVSLSFWWQARHHLAWADLIHYHFPYPWGDLLAFWPQARKPTVVTYHSDIVKQRYLRRLYAPLMHAFLRRADVLVATSPPYAETSPVLARYRDKVSIVPIGLVDSGAPPSPSTVTALRDRVGAGFFLFVGVLRYYKGLTTLLEAVQGCDWPVVIAGDGPMMPTLRQICMDRQLDQVQFLERVTEEEKMALLSLCRAVVVPANARSEAFCITLVEGLRAGKPLISTEVGSGTSYVNQAGVTGEVVPPESPVALRAAMRRLVEEPTLAMRYGLQARQRFEALFTAERMADGYEAIYEQWLGGV